ILEALGLSFADLHEGPLQPVTPSSPQAVIATYEYRDIGDRVYAHKVRLGPEKSFRWERPSLSGKWARGLGGMKPGLFGVEMVVDVTRVVVVEGEKAALHHRRLRGVAVAPPAGASVWMDRWAEALWCTGAREVVVLTDA